jgi:guanosine-3',5'-bis(diphosphate) 3'-pyrophosphohydrolase
MLRLAKCCRPVPGDEIVGYISLGRGITIHREDCPNVALLRKDPERFTNVAWDGDADGLPWSRSRSTRGIATACSRTSRACSRSRAQHPRSALPVDPPMVKNRFVVEVADTHTLIRRSRACATSTRCSTPTA